MEIGPLNATIQARTFHSAQIAILTVILYALLASQASFILITTIYQMTFAIGHGNDIMCLSFSPAHVSNINARMLVRMAIRQVGDRFVGKKTEDVFANMGKTWGYLLFNPQV